MPEWCELPVDIQKKCVQKMCLITRINLSSSSRASRRLVKSVPLPRARLYSKKRRFLIVVYTGIEKFVQLEIEGIDICQVMRTSDTPHLNKLLFFPTKDLFFTMDTFNAILTLFTIDTVEFMFTDFFINDLETLIATIMSDEFIPLLRRTNVVFLGDLKQLVYFRNFNVSTSLLTVVCPDVKKLEWNDDLRPSFVSETIFEFPFMTTEQVTLIFDKIPYPTERNALYLGVPTDSTFYCPSSPYPAQEAYFDALPGELQHYQNGDLWLKTKTNGNTIYHLSKCGVWTDRCTPAKEPNDSAEDRKHHMHLHKHPEHFCGLGHFCKVHADPFNYWYHRTLPFRLLTEPYWADAILNARPYAVSNQMHHINDIDKYMKKVGGCPKEFEAIELKEVVQEYYGDAVNLKPYFIGAYFVLLFMYLFVEGLLLAVYILDK